MLTEVNVGALDLERLTPFLAEDERETFLAAAVRARAELAGRSVWNVNSTASGGGVAELLATLLAYARGAGVDARWLVIEGDPEFFVVTKRIHNRLHGVPGDGGALGDRERAVYERTLERNCRRLIGLARDDDVAILHDPQTAGLIEPLRAAGLPVIWRCHVGIDEPNDYAREAWRFLQRYVEQADLVVFSRPQFAWDFVEPARRRIVTPTIDPLAPKNQELDPGAVDAILSVARLRDGPASAEPAFRRFDGSRALVQRAAQVDDDVQLRAGDRYVLQVSRWDALKDPIGVIDGFAEHVVPRSDVHLVYAGPSVDAVADDPEGADVLARAIRRRAELEPPVRERVHLAMLPMDDLEQNAAIVNALQRRAAVVVQKSLAEGFGLTVSEAMWKARPVVASRVGGIEDQIEDGMSGVLLDDPRDLAAFGKAVAGLCGDPVHAAEMGAAARERVRRRFLGTRSLLVYLDLIESLIGVRH
jgi:trehalose synthase